MSSKKKTVAIIEARMGSSRLPGKVLMDIGGVQALRLLCDRLHSCSRIDEVVIATSVNSADQAIADFGNANGIKVFREVKMMYLEELWAQQNLRQQML
ncbi:MAG: hypothetical protein IPG99_11270 [Ignavibacteria bacterium]|nr:hypothetical protein [Ignavibacteria bacterium]